jgi:hypothetical protein
MCREDLALNPMIVTSIEALLSIGFRRSPELVPEVMQKLIRVEHPVGYARAQMPGHLVAMLLRGAAPA